MTLTTARDMKGNVLTIPMDVQAGWEKWVMLSSDHHLDNIHANRKLLTEHLDEAVRRDADIFFFGDTFCAMQGKYDPRASMDDIRPEDVGQNYLDLIAQHAVDFYAPYAKNIALISPGNHESSVRRRNGTDLVSNLIFGLNRAGGTIAHGGYGGWVRFMATINKTRRKAIKMKYFHGAGGGGPVTRGTIQTNRMAVFLPDADIVVSGHTHDSWEVHIARERLSERGKIYRDIQYHIRTSTFKDEYNDGSGGWHVETGKPPKPLGMCWLRFYKHNDDGVRFEFTSNVS